MAQEQTSTFQNRPLLNVQEQKMTKAEVSRTDMSSWNNSTAECPGRKMPNIERPRIKVQGQIYQLGKNPLLNVLEQQCP